MENTIRIYESPHGLQPSTTSILGLLDKYYLRQWAADCTAGYIRKNCKCIQDGIWEVKESDLALAVNNWKSESQTAADFGTDLHSIAELYFRSFHSSEDAERLEAALSISEPDTLALFLALRDWAETEKIVPKEIEKVCHGDGYSCRVDLIAERDGKLGLYDIKTSKNGQYGDTWGLQLAANAAAYEYHTGNKIEEIGIIRLTKKTLRLNFSETGRGPHYTEQRPRLEKAFSHLVKFFWEYEDFAEKRKHLKPTVQV